VACHQVSSQRPSVRIESIDVLRGLTILGMIFVNDIAGVPDIPKWMRHMPTLSDGMTIVDLVFPAFLFIVGMSMPFSIGRRLEQGNNLWSTWKHIIIRILGLLIIGFYMVNSDVISSEGIINPHLWIFFMYLSVMIIWNKSNSKNRLFLKIQLKYVALAVLVILALLYRGQEQIGVFQMRPHWWGILGLIGWAYLVACLIYIPFRRSQLGILGGMVLLYCFYMADEAGLMTHISFMRKFIHTSYALGSHAAIILSGVLLGTILKQDSANSNHKNIVKRSFLFSIGLFAGGLLLHALNDIHIIFIISKDLGTVPWCLISSAITIWVWIAIYWLIDMKGFRSWTKIIKPAGANPLFAYILAPFVIDSFALLAYIFNGFNVYSWLGHTFYLGLFRAIVLAFSMTWLAGFLSAKGLQLKL
jgi:predicted acyltransferase